MREFLVYLSSPHGILQSTLLGSYSKQLWYGKETLISTGAAGHISKASSGLRWTLADICNSTTFLNHHPISQN